MLLRSIFPTVLLLTSFVLFSCSEPEISQDLETYTVQFSCNLMDADDGGRLLEGEEPEFLVLSLETITGESVLSMEEINIYRIGSSFIAEPIDLVSGTYTVTDFFLVSESKEIIHAVPKYGSAFQSAVSRPLPFKFYVGKDHVSEIAVEVMNVENVDPEKIGYASFNIAPVNPLRIAVFKGPQKIQLTDAEAQIYKGEELLKSFELKAMINTISFQGEADDHYTLKIMKDGCANYVLDFQYDELVSGLDNLLLEAILNPAFTFSGNVAEWLTFPNTELQFGLTGESADIKINFGDGSPVQELSLNGYAIVTHLYQSSGSYHVEITGDIHLIQYFEQNYDQAPIEEIDFYSLTGLTDVQILLSSGPSKVDLTNNNMLSGVDLTGISSLEEVLLPQEHMIRYLWLDGPNALDPEELDRIIDNVYNNAIAKNIESGGIGLGELWYIESGEFLQFSEESYEKLSILVNDYGWYVSPTL